MENMVYANQQAYYDAMTQSSAIGNSQENEIKILGLIRSDRHISAKRLADGIGASQRQVERILAEYRAFWGIKTPNQQNSTRCIVSLRY